jgi:hypothetical protein
MAQSIKESGGVIECRGGRLWQRGEINIIDVL